MGATRNNFFKFPRTPHLSGSKGADDDRHLSLAESSVIITDPSLIVQEKLDGTNVGIHFTDRGRMILQCRGHELTGGMHPQYDFFKQWAGVRRAALETLLGNRFIIYGEWLYARHNVHYRRLPHYFFEYDIFDKESQCFFDLATCLQMLKGSGLQTVPVIHRGSASVDELMAMIGPSAFDSIFENPRTGRADNLMEGIYLRTEDGGHVTGRAKLVRPEFVDKVKGNEDWKQQVMIPNLLATEVNLWA